MKKFLGILTVLVFAASSAIAYDSYYNSTGSSYSTNMNRINNTTYQDSNGHFYTNGGGNTYLDDYGRQYTVQPSGRIDDNYGNSYQSIGNQLTRF